MAKLLFLGDIKANLDKAYSVLCRALKRHPDIDYVFQTGDIGFYMSNQLNLEKAAPRLKRKKDEVDLIKKYHREGLPRFPKKVHAISGDFDDYYALKSYRMLKANIHYLERSGEIMIDGTALWYLSGIYSKKRYTPNKNLNDQPIPKKEQRFIRQMDMAFTGGTKEPKVLLCHQAPQGIGPVGKEGSAPVRSILMKYNLDYLIHGHHHKNYIMDYNGTKIIGLGNLNADASSYRVIEI